MSGLNPATCRRLRQLPQLPGSVWEGERRSLRDDVAVGIELMDASKSNEPSDCVIWVDGSQGIVRAMDMVPTETGMEAVVRTLLRAMEQPHNPGMPARPQKIVVRDRELLFYLRGVLQELDITLDYVPDLPLIDEIFDSFREAIGSRPPQLPPAYATALPQKAAALWQQAPWQYLADHQILSITLNRWDMDTLYACIMGNLGKEFGVLFYRSQESLRQFRQTVLQNQSMEQMEEAFLSQDCLYITFEPLEEVDDLDTIELGDLAASDVEAVFGNLHPLEGMRPFLYDEEAAALYVALEGLHRFFQKHLQKLDGDFPAIKGHYRIALPKTDPSAQSTCSIEIQTEPELADELLNLEGDNIGLASMAELPILQDDLVPENAFLSLGMVSWPVWADLREQTDYQPLTNDISRKGDGLPVIMVQTSRPKAKDMIQQLKAAGGLQGICFNPGEDPVAGDRYDVGLLQAANQHLYLFGEFGADDPVHIAARQKWEKRCRKTKGCCGLIVAMGITGANRGNPQLKDMLALFEAHAIDADELGLGTLQLRLALDWM